MASSLHVLEYPTMLCIQLLLLFIRLSFIDQKARDYLRLSLLVRKGGGTSVYSSLSEGKSA